MCNVFLHTRSGCGQAFPVSASCVAASLLPRFYHLRLQSYKYGFRPSQFYKIFLSQDYTPRNTYSRPIRIPSPFRLNRITVLLVSDILHTPSLKTRAAAVTRYRWGSAAVCIIPFLTGLAYVHLTISFPTAFISPSAISRT